MPIAINRPASAMMLALSTPRRPTTLRNLRLCSNCASIVLRTFSSDEYRFRPSKFASDILKTLPERPERLLIFRSHSNDPLFNLALENHLLRNSHPDSRILLTYSNRPCVVIGRNQNAWSEVNLSLLRKPPEGMLQQQQPQQQLKDVVFVRRLSGGGTVYHDLGNLCWSLITPRESFDRDTGAHMVVRALEKMGVSARVNERHDIVVPRLVPDDSQASPSPSSVPTVETKKVPESDIKSEDNKKGKDDSKSTVPVKSYGNVKLKEFKVSGSAYKLKQKRAYHHATLLLSTDLSALGSLLRSPIDRFIDGKGVKSVKSDVTNLDVDKETFISRLETEFKRQYATAENSAARCIEVDLGDEILNQDLEGAEFKIWDTMDEMRSKKFQMGQTPKFTFSIPPLTRLPELPGLPGLCPTMPKFSEFTINVESGKIKDCTISLSTDSEWAFVQSAEMFELLKPRHFDGGAIANALRNAKSMNRERNLRDLLAMWLEHAIATTRDAQAEKELEEETQERKKREVARKEEVERRKQVADWSVQVRGPVRRVPNAMSITDSTVEISRSEPWAVPRRYTAEQQGEADSSQDGLLSKAKREYGALPSDIASPPRVRNMLSTKYDKSFNPNGKREFHTSARVNSPLPPGKSGKLRFVEAKNTDKTFARFEPPPAPEDPPPILRPTFISRNLEENLRAHEFKHKSGVKVRVHQVDSQLSKRAKEERRINPAELDFLSRVQLEREKNIRPERIRFTWEKQMEERLKKANADWEEYQRTHKGGERFIPVQDLQDRVLELQDDLMVYTPKPTPKPNILPGASWAARTGKPYVVFDPEIGRMSADVADEQRRETEKSSKTQETEAQPHNNENWFSRKLEMLDAEDQAAGAPKTVKPKSKYKTRKPIQNAEKKPGLFTQNLMEPEEDDPFADFNSASSNPKNRQKSALKQKQEDSIFEQQKESNQLRLRIKAEHRQKEAKAATEEIVTKKKKRREQDNWYDNKLEKIREIHAPELKPINTPGLTVRKGAENESDVRWLPDAQRKRAEEISEWRLGKRWVDPENEMDHDEDMNSQKMDSHVDPENDVRRLAQSSTIGEQSEDIEEFQAKEEEILREKEMLDEEEEILNEEEEILNEEEEEWVMNEENHRRGMKRKQKNIVANPKAKPQKTSRGIFPLEYAETIPTPTTALDHDSFEFPREKKERLFREKKRAEIAANWAANHRAKTDKLVAKYERREAKLARKEEERSRSLGLEASEDITEPEIPQLKWQSAFDEWAVKIGDQELEKANAALKHTMKKGKNDSNLTKDTDTNSVHPQILAIRERIKVLKTATKDAESDRKISQEKDAKMLTPNPKKLSKKIKKEMQRETRRQKKVRKRKRLIASLEIAEKTLLRAEAKKAATKAAEAKRNEEWKYARTAQASSETTNDLKDNNISTTLSNAKIEPKSATTEDSDAQESNSSSVAKYTKSAGKTVMDVLSSASGLLRNRLADARKTGTSDSV